ncbi:sporulation membrane protein YtaF [Clostridium sp. MB40-C1]|uniref:sporulation membrane protein YtaF n=1 Tax=Clostridium sp. MB40-C1 TaxID=3070996 RepID=UPI0027E0FC46|nr:sporulation membrane protein YtaF [Clostridium sp. MB40-C1]WMJ80824.1 sporulation membrane protein YtaF [Clostridium sp. MB40-C1]
MLESLLLVSVVCLDSFVASVAYGTNKIKIPFISANIINIISSSFLALALALGSVIKKVIPYNVTSIISFIVLFLFGIYYLAESLIKTYVKKHSNSNKKVKLKFCDLNFIIDIYIDETKADADHSKTLNPKEALYLAIALSLDSLAVGFGSSLGNINYIQIIILCLVMNMIAIYGGMFIGKKFVEKSKLNLSWLSGVILIILATMRIL